MFICVGVDPPHDSLSLLLRYLSSSPTLLTIFLSTAMPLQLPSQKKKHEEIATFKQRRENEALTCVLVTPSNLPLRLIIPRQREEDVLRLPPSVEGIPCYLLVLRRISNFWTVLSALSDAKESV